MMNDYSIKDLLKVAFSESHLRDPEVMYPIKENGHREAIKVSSLTNQSNKLYNQVALIALGVITLGIGWLVYDLYTGHRKIQIIEKDHLNLSSIILSKPMPETAITYSLSGGRLGDNLVSFLAAYYVAYTNNLPFYYTPFEDSDKFCLSDKLEPIASNFSFKEKMELNTHPSIDKIKKMDKNSSTLITIKAFADVRPNWNYPGFKEAVRELIKPKTPIDPIPVPSEKIPIALHMRMGGGFDSEAEKRRVPAKFPPPDFYENGLQKMIETYGKDKKFYVHLFTDHNNPAELAQKLKQKFPDIDIEFGYRKEENKHDIGVLDDMFGMTQFKAMIRPWSGLSQVAEIIGEAEYVYEPQGWMPPLKKNESLIVPGKLTDKKLI